jgi:hypothetical protein
MGNSNVRYIHFHNCAKQGKVEEVLKSLAQEPSLVNIQDNVRNKSIIMKRFSTVV